MKLLFDENLSAHLPCALADIYPNSVHVHECGLGTAEDSAIWHYAKNYEFTIVSKDSDFQERSVLLGHPPKVIWLRVPNCSTTEIETLRRTAQPVINHFISENRESCLILGPRKKPSRL